MKNKYLISTIFIQLIILSTCKKIIKFTSDELSPDGVGGAISFYDQTSRSIADAEYENVAYGSGSSSELPNANYDDNNKHGSAAARPSSSNIRRLKFHSRAEVECEHEIRLPIGNNDNRPTTNLNKLKQQVFKFDKLMFNRSLYDLNSQFATGEKTEPRVSLINDASNEFLRVKSEHLFQRLFDSAQTLQTHLTTHKLDKVKLANSGRYFCVYSNDKLNQEKEFLVTNQLITVSDG